MCDKSSQLWLRHLANPEYEFYNGRSNPHGESFLTCIIAGILVMWVLMSLFKSSTTPVQNRNQMNPIYYPTQVIETSARIVSNVVSGRLSVPVQESGLMNLKQCQTFLKISDNNDINKNVMVADCKDGDWKNLKDPEKAIIDKALREWLDSKVNEPVAIMVYAPWCPHCHKMMPDFVNTYPRIMKNLRGQGQMLIINAEATRRETFTAGKPDCLHPIKYFPTFLIKPKGRTEFKEVELSQLVKDYTEEDTVVEDIVVEDTTVVEDMLAQLF